MFETLSPLNEEERQLFNRAYGLLVGSHGTDGDFRAALIRTTLDGAEAAVIGIEYSAGDGVGGIFEPLAILMTPELRARTANPFEDEA